jgi:hypothetical protein
MGMTKLCITTCVLICLNLSCSQRVSPEGIRVMSHDAASGRWTFVRVTQQKKGRVLKNEITGICSSYHWSNRKLVTGPDACSLLVGRFIQDRVFLEKNEAHLGHGYIFEDSDTLTIIEGDGDDRVSQQFKVIESRVLEP